MRKLERLRIWVCVNFLGIFIWPSVKMDFVQIVSYPPAPYEIAKLLGMSPWQYWLKVEVAMKREAAAMLDILGFVTQQTQYAKEYMQWVYNDFMGFEPIIWKANNPESLGMFDHDRFRPKRYIRY